MATTSASPIDITGGRRFNSQSPRNNQPSNLQFALQEAEAPDVAASEMYAGQRPGNDGRLSVGGRNDSISGGSYYGSGARPISMKDRPRRESTANGSLLNGMSWGGISVGSWVRDDILMAGTSPMAFQSPSFHSSSYLPKMEASFMKDFSCCGITLDSLHDLLQHFEEVHAQPSAQALARLSQSSQGGAVAASRPDSSNTMNPTASDAGINPQRGFNPPQTAQQSSQSFQPQPSNSNGFNRTQLSTVQDMDELGDMEMDDANQTTPPAQNGHQHYQQQNQQQYNANNSRIPPPLNMNLANAMQSSGLRRSTPTTPSSGYPLQNNPTVSSVNTPTLGTHPMQQNISPESSIPGTPAEMDPELMAGFSNLGMPMGEGFDWSAFGMGAGNGMNGMNGMEGTIDQPAKRLFGKGGGVNQQQLRMALANGQLGSDDIAKRQQLINGGFSGFPGEEPKPFRCPVIGCEKAYKNQNGLKYHKQHGHQNQQLKENADGTFSIVDPITSIPYPGTMGMEKEKPYRCEVCGKRYKNLNGLKYHRQHSPPCNPDLKLGNIPGMNKNGMPVNLQGMNANVAGAGLQGMGDPPMY